MRAVIFKQKLDLDPDDWDLNAWWFVRDMTADKKKYTLGKCMSMHSFTRTDYSGEKTIQTSFYFADYSDYGDVVPVIVI